MKQVREGYKMTELGEIPVEWELKELNSLARKEEKYAFSGGPFGSDLTSNDYTEAGVQIIQLQNIGEGCFYNNHQIFTSDSKADELKKCNIYPGDLVIAKMAEPVARACIVPKGADRYLMASDAIRLSTDPEIIDKHFLMYAINSRYFRKLAEANSTGSTRLRIGLTTLSKLNILYPPIKEQEKIAEILSTVDEQIENTEQRIEKAKDLKRGLMQQLLTKGIGHTEFKQTELGEIPVEWEVRLLEELVDFSNGKAHEQLIVEEEKYILINSKFISSEGKVKKYSSEELQPLKINDITMVMSDVPNGRALAKCFIVDKEGTYTLNQRICLLRSKKINTTYLFYFLNRNKYFLKFDDGVGQTNLRKNEVLECPVIIPTLPEQQKIAEILSSIDEQIENYEQEKQKYLELKKGLMQQLLTGQLRVTV
ncbi:restriction endonuclease subunit S [Brevibacillus sp. 179-C9.3 HS]|uniref:restriction endonuclease subunit S n=1 Tax=unclassified Brevibacillus TaxID=2684853 RepID=UPI0039A2A267